MILHRGEKSCIELILAGRVGEQSLGGVSGEGGTGGGVERLAGEGSDVYLALVMLFLAATSLAVRGSGSDVGMGEFWGREQLSLMSQSQGKSCHMISGGGRGGLTRRFGTGQSFPVSLKAK